MSKNTLRIAIAAGLYPPFLTGVSVAVHQRTRWLLQQGHEVFLIHPGINDRYPPKVGKCLMPGLNELQNYPKFKSYAFPTQPMIFNKSLPSPLSYRHWDDTKLLEDFNPDVVLIEEPAQLRGLYSLFLQGYGRPMGAEYAKKTGTPTISLFHTDIVSYIPHYLGDQVYFLIRPFIPLLAKYISESYDLNLFASKAQLAKYKAMNCQRSEYLPHQTIDSKKFNPENIVYNPIPDDNRPVLLFVGRITAEKNVTQLFDIYSIVASYIEDVHLVIVGSGPIESEVKERAQKFASGVTVWGESHGEELLGWFARADVFVNPSTTEFFCTTNNEALASGTPVVAAVATSTAEQVTPGHNGFLAEPNNPKDFANKIIQILENPQLKQQMSSNAPSSILEFDWAFCMEKLESKLYKIIEKSPNKLAYIAS